MHLKAGLLLAIAISLLAPAPAWASAPDETVEAPTSPGETTAGQTTAEPSSPSVIDDSGESDELDTLERLSLLGRVLRVRFSARTLPSANFGSSEVGRWTPEARFRVRFPITEDSVGRVTARFRSARYNWGGGNLFGSSTLQKGLPNDFYGAAIELHAAHAADFVPKLFIDGEVWSLVAGAWWRSRWAPGAFDEGMTGGGLVGISYALTDRLRIVLGVGVESRIGRSGVRFRPTGSLHWKISERWKIRTRGLGAQIDYAIIRPVSFFATAHRFWDNFALDQTTAKGQTVVFRDRPEALVGGGFKWQITKRLRLIAEGGVVIGRKLNARVDGENILSSMRADPHGYFDLRLLAGR
jgi:hypothetical protein